MGYDKETRRFGNTLDNDRYMSDEQRARQQAYEEYLSLRENRAPRGNYVKNDDLYGSYFSNGRREDRSRDELREEYMRVRRGRSIDNTPYGSSEMRRRSQKEQIARQGRVNRADKELFEEKPVRRADNRFDDRSAGAIEEKPSRARAKRKEKASRKAAKRKKKGRGLKISFAVVLILVIALTGVLVAGVSIVKNTLDNVGRVDLDPNMIGINPVVDQQLSNYRNIALLGIDARDMSNDAGVRSDAIIIASINKETGEIKLFSVYRDTMLDLGDDVGLDKITHAYYYGGPTKVLYTLNKNLDLNIKEVMVVNWKSVADVVDALGGIDVKIEDSEINELNRIIDHTAGVIGGSSEDVTASGKQTLNGNQAVAYARIRKDAATGDYRRNERMKIVVKSTFNKAMQMDVKALRKISNEILPEVKTNMSSRNMMGMMMDITSYEMTDSIGWPYTTRGWTGNAWYGPPVTLYTNVVQLHEELFAQDGYEPTQDVNDISARISATTGYY
ncbi:MAG: LCP family protein [Firmicutes bacterium]|nr:LCP family protein [Bacillota bacterium]